MIRCTSKSKKRRKQKNLGYFARHSETETTLGFGIPTNHFHNTAFSFIPNSPSINNSSINNQQQAQLGSSFTIHNAKDTKLTTLTKQIQILLSELKRIDSPFISFKQYTYGDDLPEQGVDGGNRGGGARPYGPGLQSEDRP